MAVYMYDAAAARDVTRTGQLVADPPTAAHHDGPDPKIAIQYNKIGVIALPQATHPLEAERSRRCR
jgi:hypothetical protein